MKPATVAEIIEVLKLLPQDLPCYFRPKYFGDCKYTDMIPINLNGISIMEGGMNEEVENVTFLC